MDPREKQAREAKQRQKQELLNKAYSQVVETQLKKLEEAKKKMVTRDDEERHKEALARERETALAANFRKRSTTLSAKHEELARKTGLNGS